MPDEITPERLTRWRQAALRGRAWLAGQASADPAFGSADADLNWFCKVPWALVGSGDRASALRLLRIARAKFIEPQFREPREQHWTNAPGYALGWLVTGARACEAYAEARAFYAALQPYLSPTTGGLTSAKDDSAWLDAGIQGAALHATVAMGDWPAAKRLGDLLARFVDDQPDPGTGIYTHFCPRRGYFTDIAGDDDSGRYLFRAGDADQPLANLGFVMQGLLRVSEATGDPKYRQSSQRLLDRVLQNHRADLLAHSQNHKVGHAALLLSRYTGISDLLSVAITIADRIAQNIQPDGRALADVFHDNIAEQQHYFTIRTTCDSVLWLSQICDEI